MGLISFLKRKFGKHSAEEEQKIIDAETDRREQIQQKKAEKIQQQIDKPVQVIGDFGQVVKNPCPDDLKKAEEEAIKNRPKQIEIKSHEEIKKEVVVETEETKKAVTKYVAGLDKSRLGFTDKLNRLAHSHRKVNKEYLDALEAILFEADVSYDIIVDVLKEISQIATDKDVPPDEVNDILIDKLFISYAND